MKVEMSCDDGNEDQIKGRGQTGDQQVQPVLQAKIQKMPQSMNGQAMVQMKFQLSTFIPEATIPNRSSHEALRAARSRQHQNVQRNRTILDGRGLETAAVMGDPVSRHYIAKPARRDQLCLDKHQIILLTPTFGSISSQKMKKQKINLIPTLFIRCWVFSVKPFHISSSSQVQAAEGLL